MRSRPVALFGLVMMVPIGLGLLRGDLGLDTAGTRTLVLLVVLFVVDRVVVPIARAVVGSPSAATAGTADGDDVAAPDRSR